VDRRLLLRMSHTKSEAHARPLSRKKKLARGRHSLPHLANFTSFLLRSQLLDARSIIDRGLQRVHSQRDWMDQNVLFVIVLIFNLRIGIKESSQGSEIYSIHNKLPSYNPPECKHTGFLYNNQVHFEYAFPDERYLESILQSLVRLAGQVGSRQFPNL